VVVVVLVIFLFGSGDGGTFKPIFVRDSHHYHIAGRGSICQVTISSFSENIFVVSRPTFLVRLFWQLRNIRNGILVSEMYNTLWVYQRFTV
jgi:hypothetical protein